jgi:hypothetical protein
MGKKLGVVAWLWLALSFDNWLSLGHRSFVSAIEDRELSCSSVYDDVDDQADFCIMVTWLAAQMYVPSNYSLYYPQSPVSLDEQDIYAKDLYHSLRDSVKSNRPSCKNALKRLACAQVFPE